MNVADQRTDPDSLLSFIALLIRRYRESPELGWADFHILDQPQQSVLAHMSTWDDRRLVAVHNLGPVSCTVPLTLEDCDSEHQLVDLLQDTGATDIDDNGCRQVALDGYGYRWLRVVSPVDKRLA